jgi:hypothetical protein
VANELVSAGVVGPWSLSQNQTGRVLKGKRGG